MKSRSFLFLLLAAFLILSAATPQAARAETVDLIVEHNPTDSSHFSSIQAAILHAKAQLAVPSNTTTFRIKVKADPDPYVGQFTPISSVPIIGGSTAGTFLSGGGSQPLVLISNVSNVTISNFTFIATSFAISVTNSSNVSITNNVFNLGGGTTAVQVATSPSTSITNNTFHNNGTAISTTSDILITNDIFSSNQVAINTNLPLPQLSFSDFFANNSNGVGSLGQFSIPDSMRPDANPRFVDPLNRDFHLQADSPAKGTGNTNPVYRNSFNQTSDMGAYGGPNSDLVATTVPKVTGVTSQAVGDSGIEVSWGASTSSDVTYYRVYYGTSSRNYGPAAEEQAAQGPPPILVPAGTTRLVLSGFPVSQPTPPTAPHLVSVTPLNHALQLTWTPVQGATGYLIYVSTANFTGSSLPPNPVRVGVTQSAQLNGLQNDTTYYVAVSAIAQKTEFVAVTAVVDPAIAPNPGGNNESAYSQEIVQGIGPIAQSGIDNVLSDFPEAASPYPNLKSGGCFIATAAYGFYSAPQVQALRIFRDRYLMTNAPGRAFVAWYYHYGPGAAKYLNAHPWLKPPVRLALLPLVALSVFLVYTPPLLKLGLLPVALAMFGLYRRKQGKVPLLAGRVQ